MARTADAAISTARKPQRYGVIGAGAVGTIVAAYLARAGPTTLFVRSADDATRIARDGLVLNGEVPQPVTVTADPRAASACDVLVVAVKTTATAGLAIFAPYVPPECLVATLQNGLGNEVRLREALGASVDVVLAPTMTGGTLVRPGMVRNARVLATTIGRVPHSRSAVADAALERLAARFRAAGLPATVAADVRGAVWAKAIVNGAINALAALHGVPNGALLEDPDLRAAAATLAEEGAAVVSALGIVLPGDAEATAGDAVRRVEAAIRATATNRNSMLQDLEAGRPTEIDALNGAIVRAAECAGVLVPAHREMSARISERERG